jgi:hypothetical protein
MEISEAVTRGESANQKNGNVQDGQGQSPTSQRNQGECSACDGDQPNPVNDPVFHRLSIIARALIRL